ncbi:thermonuclease family protein [Niveibacterium sp. 24ML]|uniref:thermonuclease family protein n=1 Tax=Niveibacterium sp. 24ML TaxID=2985512 RepID=UPI002270C9A6|nr:thermonuclease family protein [Niveibacterium sp. 24ML]MCX9158043.1 thermonuclease family protein [Niveibacterium sp. 24ML]
MTGALLLCLIVGVSDGDTVTARCSAETIKVRLSEIDAPEKAQPYGERSKQALSDLCFQHNATIEDKGQDRYQRKIGRVHCAGVDANLRQVQMGLAWAYTKYLTDPAIRQAEDSARSARSGLWADDSPSPPWEWRHKRRTRSN